MCVIPNIPTSSNLVHEQAEHLSHLVHQAKEFIVYQVFPELIGLNPEQLHVKTWAINDKHKCEWISPAGDPKNSIHYEEFWVDGKPQWFVDVILQEDPLRFTVQVWKL